MHNESRRRAAPLAGPAAVALALFGTPVAAAHDYTVAVASDLSRLQVEAHFDTAVHGVRARARDAGRLLIDARDCGVDGGTVLRNRRIELPAGGVHCLHYVVDLGLAAAEERRNRTLSAGNVLASPSAWLWRPQPADDADIRVRFRLPGAMRVAVPWQVVAGQENTYLLGRSPESANAVAAFGAFEYHELDVAGASLRVSLLKNDRLLRPDVLLNWVRATATDVTLAYGRFPNPSPQVIVLPAGDGRGGVAHGRVVRDGGESIELSVDQAAPLADLLGDWTATHEFSHLLLPYVAGRHKWVSEGFAQYYQNVLLARAGAYDARYAWQKIYDGLGRGRASRPELSPNEAAAERSRGGLMKLYWSGAAIALLADVTLRERSGGSETLDDVLDRLQACCLPSDAAWSGPDLFGKLDSLLGAPVFMPLYDRHADTPGFPDLAGLFDRLGLETVQGEIRLAPDAELAAIRDAITATDPVAAERRRQIAAD